MTNAAGSMTRMKSHPLAVFETRSVPRYQSRTVLVEWVEARLPHPLQAMRGSSEQARDWFQGGHGEFLGGSEGYLVTNCEMLRIGKDAVRTRTIQNAKEPIEQSYLLRSILRDERRVLTVSRMQEGALGLTNVALSSPTELGTAGAVEVLEPEISSDERRQRLQHSAVDAAAGRERATESAALRTAGREANRTAGV